MTETARMTALGAWVDESIHVNANLYLLAAAVATTAPEDLDTSRDRLRAIARRTRGRTHWINEEERDRLRISRLGLVAEGVVPWSYREFSQRERIPREAILLEVSCG